MGTSVSVHGLQVLQLATLKSSAVAGKYCPTLDAVATYMMVLSAGKKLVSQNPWKRPPLSLGNTDVAELVGVISATAT